jgi:hypothetical protein
MRIPPALRDLPRMLRRTPRIVRNAVRDLRYGAPLGGTVRSRYSHLGAHDVGNADYDDLAVLFAEVEVGADDVIVDVGAGKGRALNWFLGRYPGTRIYGIELDPEICARTQKRLSRYPDVTVICGDATSLLPADGTVFYLFNPFDETVMRRFAGALLALGPAPSGRPRRVVYLNYKFLEPFLEEPRFEVRPLELPLAAKAALIELR